MVDAYFPVVDALAEEIGLMLAEGVVADAQDIDLCMILGAGWPMHLGGITPYLDRTGASERVLGLERSGIDRTTQPQQRRHVRTKHAEGRTYHNIRHVTARGVGAEKAHRQGRIEKDEGGE